MSKKCDVCFKLLVGKSRKRCKTCRPTSTCCDCGKKFQYKVILQRCTTCQYHWYKTNTPEKFEIQRVKTLKKIKQNKRLKRGLPLDHIFPKGPRGEGYLNKKGYRLMVKVLETGKYKRIYKHVLVMSEFLGRDLHKNERVHHLNGQRDDNRIENLELWSIAQPPGQRVTDKVKWCIEFLNAYGYSVDKL